MGESPATKLQTKRSNRSVEPNRLCLEYDKEIIGPEKMFIQIEMCYLLTISAISAKLVFSGLCLSKNFKISFHHAIEALYGSGNESMVESSI